MENETKVDSVTADIEPTVLAQQVAPEATSRVEDPQVLVELSESAVFPADTSELNAVMELIEQELSQIDPLEPIIDFDELEAPAAGVAGGGESEGGGIIRVDRIVEGVNGNEYTYETTAQDIQNEFLGLSVGEQPIEDSVVIPTAPEVIDNESIESSAPEDEAEDDSEEGEGPIDEQDPPIESPEEDTPEEPGPTPPEEEEIVPGQPEDPIEEDPDGHQPEPPVDDRPDVTPPRGPQGNNGWGNGDQNAPGNSGPNNNAENNTSGKEDPRGGGNGVPSGNSGNGNASGGDNSSGDGNTRSGSNPGNDKPVGNSPWDGETGASGNPGRGRHQDGIDDEPNQPPGRRLMAEDLLDDFPVPSGFNGTSSMDLLSLQLNIGGINQVTTPDN